MKTILITGASSGIGLAIAKLMIPKGNRVVGVARDFTLCDDVNMEKVVLDLSQLSNLTECLRENKLLQLPFDVLILNAGYGRFGGLEQFSYNQIQHLINTNLVSNLFLIKHYLPAFKITGGKDIIIIGSESALQGAKQGAVYCASKFALRGLAQSLRADCSSADIRVMMVNPGPVKTDFFDDLNFQPQEGEEFALLAESVAQAVMHGMAQSRNSVTEEINIQPLKRSFEKKR